MLRSQALRITTRTNVVTQMAGSTQVSTRHYATEPKSPADNTLLYTALGVAAVGGAYFYFRQSPDKEERLGDRARVYEEEMKQKVRESAATARSRAGGVVGESKQKYDDAKDTAKKRFDDSRSGVDQKAEDMKGKGSSIVDNVKDLSGSFAKDAEAKYDSAKQSVVRSRDSTERLYDEARDATERRAQAIQTDLEKAGGDTKERWFNFKGWGKSKIEEGEDKLKRGREGAEEGIDKSKQYTAQKAAEGAEGVRDRAEKHA